MDRNCELYNILREVSSSERGRLSIEGMEFFSSISPFSFDLSSATNHKNAWRVESHRRFKIKKKIRLNIFLAGLYAFRPKQEQAYLISSSGEQSRLIMNSLASKNMGIEGFISKDTCDAVISSSCELTAKKARLG